MERRVMVVDDEPLLRSNLKIVLKRAGWTVRTHDSGFGLAVAMREFQPHVLLLDIEMPGLSGDSALRATSSLLHVPFTPPQVVLFSGRPAEELASRVRACGAWSYLTKPASHTEVCEILEQALEAAHNDEDAPTFSWPAVQSGRAG